MDISHSHDLPEGWRGARDNAGSESARPDPDPRRNPYIGPTAFKTGQPLYGRDRELNQLTNLLVAERIVLLHSPSGAGKTSLIQAALIPKLTAMRFRVLPVARVNWQPLVPGQGDAGNRYVLSTLYSLNAGLPEDERVPEARLSSMTLKEYLDARPERDQKPAVELLIFDQFEEIVSLDITDRAAKEEFFRQVGEVFGDPRLWGLFSMRDDYVAALVPYETWIPNRLGSRMRLDLLDSEAARLAILRPAEQAGVTIEETVVQRLVDDLRRVRIQRADGSLDIQKGPYIEPVQLQVVCRRLWETARPHTGRITIGDLAGLEDVDQSLAAYYASRVASVAEQAAVSQRKIREWFDRRVITEQGVRGSVLMGEEKSGDLENQAVRLLEDAYLIRAEKRGGITWFELAHDRLIAPIRADNQAWFENNLNLLQQQADLWDRQGRPENLLMTGPQLAEAVVWAQTGGVDVLPSEDDFLSASQKHASRSRMIRRRNQAITLLAVIALLFAIITWIAYRQAVAARNEADTQASIALANQLAAQSQTSLATFPLRSMLLAVEAAGITSGDLPPQPAAQEALRAALRDPHGLLLPGHTLPVRSLAYSPDGVWLATGSDDAVVRLWQMGGSLPGSPILFNGHTGPITALAFDPAQRWLATGSQDQTIRLWDLQAAGEPRDPLLLSGPRSEIHSLDFSPSGEWLAAAMLDQTVLLWPVASTGPIPQPLDLPLTGIPWVLAFSPDGRWLATGDGPALQVWDLSMADPSAHPLHLPGHDQLVTSLAFSPDGRWLASGSRDSTIRLWDLNTRDPAAEARLLTGHTDWVNDLAFSPDGSLLASASGDGTLRLWDPADPALDSNPQVLRGHSAWVNTLAFSLDGGWLASAGGDGVARLWDLRSADPAASSIVLNGHEDQVSDLAFQPDGFWLATGSLDHTVRLWRVGVLDPSVDPLVLPGSLEPVNSIVVDPGGQWFSVGRGDPAQGRRENDISLWKLDESGQAATEIRLRGDWGWVQAQAIDPGGGWLASGGGDEGIRLWDLAAAAPDMLPLVLSGHTGWVWSLAFSMDGARLASGSEDATARVWDLRASPPGSSSLVLPHDERVAAVVFSPDGHRLATASGAFVRLWDLQSSDPSADPDRLMGHSDVVTSLAFSPDGRWLASASRDASVRLWDLRSGLPLAREIVLQGHSGWVTALRFSPDGRWLATAGADHTVRLWDMGAQDPARGSLQLDRHDGAVTSLAFSPDGRWLASGSADRTARLWPLGTGAPGTRSTALRGHSNAVTTLVFSPDSHRLVTGSADHTVRQWLVQVEDLVESACQSAGRNLTRQEWQQVFSERPYHTTCPQWSPGQ